MRRLSVLLLVLWPAAGAGQGPSAPASMAPEPRLDAPAATVPDLLRTPAGAFAGSLVLPGAGQAALGLKRWLVYGALELAFWGVHLEAAADYRRLATAYRDLAWEAARSPTGPAERVDGSFGYYETVSQYVTSGAYDRDPGAPGLQPEDDPATYNGTVWELARQLFLPGGTGDPGTSAYDDALAYYEEKAAGPGFLWDWSGRLSELDRYRGIIRDADAEARVRATALGLVLANHMVSAVDALVVARLRGEAGVRLESRIHETPGPMRWDVGVRIPLRNR